MRTRFVPAFGLLLLILVTPGCQKGPGPLAPVAGRVTYRNTALPGGTIAFVPDASRGESGPIVHARIRPDGTYALQTGDLVGAPAGWYRITVTSLANTTTTAANLPFAIPHSYVPDRYRDPELSQLACEVKANRANTIDFNLE